MPFMVSTTSPTTSPPLHGHRARRPCASWLAWRALSAFCLTVALSCSIDAAVSSSADGLLLGALAQVVVALGDLRPRRWPRESAFMAHAGHDEFVRLSCMRLSAASKGLNSSRSPSTTGVLRSPSRTRSETPREAATRRARTRAMYQESTSGPAQWRLPAPRARLESSELLSRSLSALQQQIPLFSVLGV